MSQNNGFIKPWVEQSIGLSFNWSHHLHFCGYGYLMLGYLKEGTRGRRKLCLSTLSLPEWQLFSHRVLLPTLPSSSFHTTVLFSTQLIIAKSSESTAIEKTHQTIYPPVKNLSLKTHCLRQLGMAPSFWELLLHFSVHRLMLNHGKMISSLLQMGQNLLIVKSLWKLLNEILKDPILSQVCRSLIY